MSKAEMERFADAVRADKELQGEIKKAATSNEALVDFAKSKGYDVTVDEMVAYIQARKATLSQEDLDKVAGGGKVKVHTTVYTTTEIATQAVEAVTMTTTVVQTAEVAQMAGVAAEVVIVAT